MVYGHFCAHNRLNDKYNMFELNRSYSIRTFIKVSLVIADLLWPNVIVWIVRRLSFAIVITRLLSDLLKRFLVNFHLTAKYIIPY